MATSLWLYRNYFETFCNSSILITHIPLSMCSSHMREFEMTEAKRRMKMQLMIIFLIQESCHRKIDSFRKKNNFRKKVLKLICNLLILYSYWNLKFLIKGKNFESDFDLSWKHQLEHHKQLILTEKMKIIFHISTQGVLFSFIFLIHCTSK